MIDPFLVVLLTTFLTGGLLGHLLTRGDLGQASGQPGATDDPCQESAARAAHETAPGSLDALVSEITPENRHAEFIARLDRIGLDSGIGRAFRLCPDCGIPLAACNALSRFRLAHASLKRGQPVDALSRMDEAQAAYAEFRALEVTP